MSALETLALATGLVCALAPLAQAARIGATRSAHDVSLIWLALYGVGSATWLAYGTAIGSLSLIASQATALTSVGVALASAARYRRDDRRPPRPRDIEAIGARPTSPKGRHPSAHDRGPRAVPAESCRLGG